MVVCKPASNPCCKLCGLVLTVVSQNVIVDIILILIMFQIEMGEGIPACVIGEAHVNSQEVQFHDFFCLQQSQ